MRIPRQDAAAVATGFACADKPAPEVAVLAVREALDKAGAPLAGSVLLFLTHHFARHAQAAVAATARAARCLQVAGCTAPGVFTEAQWSLDRPAAAALVLCGDGGLRPPAGPAPVLTLATPEAARSAWFGNGAPRLGIVSTDAETESPGRVWIGGKVAGDGRCEATFAGARLAVGVSRGLRALSPALEVSDADGHELFALGGQPALAVLLRELPADLREAAGLPLSHIFAALPEAGMDAAEALACGAYRLVPIIGGSFEEQSLTLALPLDPGDRLFWVLRQPAAAAQDSGETLAALAEQLPAPDFALMFACIGRGPYFFGGEDLDLAGIGERFPGLPVLGAYGAGEIAPLPGGNSLISYSAVMALVGHVRT